MVEKATKKSGRFRACLNTGCGHRQYLDRKEPTTG
jgi:hypothetical protein